MTKTISYTHEAPLTGNVLFPDEESGQHDTHKKSTKAKKVGAFVAAAGLVSAGFMAGKAVDHLSEDREAPRLSAYELANVTEVATKGAIDAIDTIKASNNPALAKELGHDMYSDDLDGHYTAAGLGFMVNQHREGLQLSVYLRR